MPSSESRKGLSILLIFSKNQLLVWLILWIVLLVSTWLISPRSLIISCRLLLLGEFSSFFSRAFRCVVKLLVCVLSSFFLEALRAMSFPLRNAFIVSHRFGYDVPSFSLNSKKSLFFLFPPWPSYWVECCSVPTWMLAFLLFMLLLKISLSSWRFDRTHGIISIFLYLFRPVL